MGLKSFLARCSKNRNQLKANQTANSFESLESRRLLSGVTATLSGSLLTVVGRPKNDVISLAESGSNIVVKAGTSTIGTFAANTVKNISFDGGKGNDQLTSALTTTSILVTIIGGLGNDSIVGGAGAEFIHGNAGNDSILANGGNDTIVGDGGNDNMDGGAGDDSVLGGGNNDLLIGGDGNDTVDGSSGLDNISGGAGNDSLVGGDGNDSISGGNGDDNMRAGNGADQIDGGKGTDLALTDDSTDTGTNVETTSAAFVPQELGEIGLTITTTADQLTGKHVTSTLRFTNVAADTQVSARWTRHDGNTFTIIADAKKYAGNVAPTAEARTIIIDFGNQNPGVMKIVVLSASGLSNLVSNFTVAWVTPTGGT